MKTYTFNLINPTTRHRYYTKISIDIIAKDLNTAMVVLNATIGKNICVGDYYQVGGVSHCFKV